MLPGNKILLKKVFSILSSLMVVIYTVASPVMCATIVETQNSKAALQIRRKELKKELQEASSRVNKETQNKGHLDKQIKIVEEQIDVSNNYITELDEEIAEAEREIERIQEDIKTKIETLKRSLSAIYVAGDTSTIDIVLGAKDFEDFLDKIDIARSVGQTIKKLIDDLHNDLEKIEKKKKEILDTKSEKEKEKENLEKSKADLQALYDKSEKLLSELQESEREVQRKIDQNDAEVKALDAQIQKYYEEQKRLEEEERHKRKEGQKPQTPSGPVVKHKGKYVWPVPGYYKITSGFNDSEGRSHAHGAIDIGGVGVYGADVVAAGSGKIIIANAYGWGGGYGKHIIIDHGNGRCTVYGHLSIVGVRAGQVVSVGQKIGNVGNTGFSSGPHLHFEYRVNGVRTDPSCILNY